MTDIINWLLEDDNPAIKYRTQTEILGQQDDKSKVIIWLNTFLPNDWKTAKGLWSTYYLSSFAECGLTFEDIGLHKETVLEQYSNATFDEGCGDFMRLRALVAVGSW